MVHCLDGDAGVLSCRARCNAILVVIVRLDDVVVGHGCRCRVAWSFLVAWMQVMWDDGGIDRWYNDKSLWRCCEWCFWKTSDRPVQRHHRRKWDQWWVWFLDC